MAVCRCQSRFDGIHRQMWGVSGRQDVMYHHHRHQKPWEPEDIRDESSSSAQCRKCCS